MVRRIILLRLRDTLVLHNERGRIHPEQVQNTEKVPFLGLRIHVFLGDNPQRFALVLWGSFVLIRLQILRPTVAKRRDVAPPEHGVAVCVLCEKNIRRLQFRLRETTARLLGDILEVFAHICPGTILMDYKMLSYYDTSFSVHHHISVCPNRQSSKQHGGWGGINCFILPAVFRRTFPNCSVFLDEMLHPSEISGMDFVCHSSNVY